MGLARQGSILEERMHGSMQENPVHVLGMVRKEQRSHDDDSGSRFEYPRRLSSLMIPLNELCWWVEVYRDT